MSVIQPVQNIPAPGVRTLNAGSNPLEEARVSANAQAGRGEASALHPDLYDSSRQPAESRPVKRAGSPAAAGTPAESGGKGVIVSVLA